MPRHILLRLIRYRAKEARREHSSVGLEHLPYKQRVGGSTPSAPTKKAIQFLNRFFFVYPTPHGDGTLKYLFEAGWTFSVDPKFRLNVKIR